MISHLTISVLVWDPSPEMFSFDIPFLGRPILWYGFFFALGFFLGFWVFLYFLKEAFRTHASKKKKEISQPRTIAERLLLYILCGTIIGARLGDVIFYQNWKDAIHHPLSIFKIWEGGLASHGGAIGVMIALWLFWRRSKEDFKGFSGLELLDLVVIPTCLVASSIRIGNFFNQEILGHPTHVAWGVIFGHPADGSAPLPRHPVQLYESAAYLVLFIFLALLWKFKPHFRKGGKISGLFFILLFSSRFVLEFFKEEQSALLSAGSPLTMGQYLSLPFIVLGCFLLFWKREKKKM
ncbi:MAG: prolipoprotein diacylglyceryl transferase [Anaerolineae bacterium]